MPPDSLSETQQVWPPRSDQDLSVDKKFFAGAGAGPMVSRLRILQTGTSPLLHERLLMAEQEDQLPESQIGHAQWLADELALCGHEDITASTSWTRWPASG